SIKRGESACASLNTLSLSRDLRADFRKDFRFELSDAVFRAEDFSLPILQFRRRVTFGIGERLPPLVINRHTRGVGFGDFNKIAEDVVEANPERSDAGARTLARFQ